MSPPTPPPILLHLLLPANHKLNLPPLPSPRLLHRHKPPREHRTARASSVTLNSPLTRARRSTRGEAVKLRAKRSQRLTDSHGKMNPPILTRVETTSSSVVLVTRRSPEARLAFPPGSRSHLLLHMLPSLHPHLTDTRHLRRRRLDVIIIIIITILVTGSRSLPPSSVITKHRRV
ncbi:hypothetical protein N665_0083s0011 [Sinapis alba]|nr:hypothetical protein N665_0083s0011 [Sinapis alba]